MLLKEKKARKFRQLIEIFEELCYNCKQRKREVAEDEGGVFFKMRIIKWKLA